MGILYTTRGVKSIHLNGCIVIFIRGVCMKMYYDRLRELREDRDLKQSDIAAILKTTQQVYSRYEKGINQIPLHHLVTLCKFYKVSADYILGI